MNQSYDCPNCGGVVTFQSSIDEVIGFQHVKDELSGWFEYLLFNPWQGFAWLVTYNGHWSFVRRLFEQPEVKEGIFTGSAAHARFNGETYRIFAASGVTTDYVLGEFYWKVAVGMKANVTDFDKFFLSRASVTESGRQQKSTKTFPAKTLMVRNGFL